MKKSTKGALAASAAGVLLLGGAGSLAFWTSDTTVGGGSIASGHLKLSAASCPGGWTIDGGDPYVAQLLVPGDTITKVCTFTVDAVGDHLTASFDASAPDLTGDPELTAELDVNAAYEVNSTPVGATGVAVVDGDTVTATITVDWPYGTENNTSNDPAGFAAVLDDITVTATQGHSAA